MPRIKGIFFDAAGVFYDRKESNTRFAERLLKETNHSVELDKAARERLVDLHVQATEGRVSHVKYWDQFLVMHGVTAREVRERLCRQILENSHDVFTYPGGKEVMSVLKERGFVLGIVTDTIYPLEWKMSWLANAGVAEYIDVVACSSVLGAHKPDPAMYRDALRKAEMQPEDAAFVGHDATELLGARKAGMVTVAVNYDPDAKADYYAHALPDLLDVPIFKEE